MACNPCFLCFLSTAKHWDWRLECCRSPVVGNLVAVLLHLLHKKSLENMLWALQIHKFIDRAIDLSFVGNASSEWHLHALAAEMIPHSVTSANSIEFRCTCSRCEHHLDVVPNRLFNLLFSSPWVGIVISHEGDEAQLAFTFGMTSVILSKGLQGIATCLQIYGNLGKVKLSTRSRKLRVHVNDEGKLCFHIVFPLLQSQSHSTVIFKFRRWHSRNLKAAAPKCCQHLSKREPWHRPQSLMRPIRAYAIEPTRAKSCKTLRWGNTVIWKMTQACMEMDKRMIKADYYCFSWKKSKSQICSGRQ